MTIHRGRFRELLLAMILVLCTGAWSTEERTPVADPAMHSSAQKVHLAQATKSASPKSAQADLDALIAAARREGEVTFYVSQTGFGERIVEGFSKKYGIKAQFVRMPGAPLLQRYSSEAVAGNIAADLILQAGVPAAWAKEGVQKGWLEPISEAGIPAMTSGEFPSKFTNGITATVMISPWIFVYNTDKVKGADVPKDWSDLFNSKFKGQILLSDPRSSDSYFDLWTLLLDKYGETFFNNLRTQNLRYYSSAVPAVQALGAGEGAIMLATSAPSALTLKGKGAPIDLVTPNLTTGIESSVILSARAKSKHPNAGRLLAHYLMSPEGNKWINESSIGVYQTTGLPREYQSPHPDALARKDTVTRLLGL